MDRLWAFLSALLCGVASCVASSCLLCWLHHIRHANHRKLMWRQLKQLAAADILFNCFVIADLAVDALSTRGLPFFTTRTSSLVSVCQAVSLVYSTGVYTSLAVEMHLAVCSAAAIFRWTSLLRALRASLACAWPLGLALAVLDVCLVGVTWRFERGCISEGPDIISVVSVLVCVLVSLASYIGSLARACAAGRVVRHRIWHRTQYYLLVVIICCVPNLIRIWTVDNVFNRNPSLHLLALTLFNLKGLANTLVYAVQSHYIRRMVSSSRGPAAETKLGEAGSFHVGVGAVDVVSVAPIAAAALERSERETAVLEVANDGLASAPSSPPALQEFLHGGPPRTPSRGLAGGGRGAASEEDVLLGCFEASVSPSDVRQGLVWTLSLADGLARREGRGVGGRAS